MNKFSIPKTNIQATRKDDPSLLDETTLEYKDDKFQTLLFYAVRQKADKVLDALIDALPLDAQNNFLETPLHVAASIGNVHALKRLLDSGANPELKTKKGTTPLMAAARKGALDCVQVLLAHAPDLSAEDTYGNDCLFYAVESNNTDVFSVLAERGAPLFHLNKRFETLHHIAAKHADLSMAVCLDGKRVPFYILSEYRETPLHHAAKKGKAELVNHYLKHGLSPSLEDSFSKTPYTYGRDYGDIEMLFTRFYNAFDNEVALNKHHLSKALRNEDFEKAMVLIKEGKNINDKDPYQNRPVLYTLIYKQKNLYDALMAKDIEKSDIDYHHHDVDFYLDLLKLNW